MDTLYDTITNYGITIIEDELYLVKNGQTIKLADNVLPINENRKDNN